MRPPLVPWTRGALLIGAGCFASMVVLGLVVRDDDRGLPVDRAFARWLRDTFDPGTPHTLVRLTDGVVTIAVVAFVAVVAVVRAKRWDVAVLAVASPLVATGLTEYVFKPLFNRTVPYVIQNFGVETEAYPSGHETATSSVLVVLAVLVLRSRLPRGVKAADLAVLVAVFALTVIGLVGQYYHYLTDAIGALLLAVSVVVGLAVTLDRSAARLAVRTPQS